MTSRRLTQINNTIVELVADIRGFRMAHYNASSRSEKIKLTKRIKAAQFNIDRLKTERKKIWEQSE